MDHRGRTLMGVLVALCALGGAALGWWLVRGLPPRAKYLLHLEYWVYLPGDVLPPQDEIMTRVVETRGIGSAEALLFSDVRLHIALVLRTKNGRFFRPDLLEPHVDATPEELQTLAESRSLVKVRYLSEDPVKDKRYLTLLPQVARAVAGIGRGRLAYDVIGERLLDIDALQDGDPGPNVRWVPEPTGGYVQTHGLRKRGLPEIRTAPIAADERWIVSEVVGQVARDAWDKGLLSDSATAEAFDDRFRVDLEPQRHGVSIARVHRIQGT